MFQTIEILDVSQLKEHKRRTSSVAIDPRGKRTNLIRRQTELHQRVQMKITKFMQIDNTIRTQIQLTCLERQDFDHRIIRIEPRRLPCGYLY